MSTDEKRAILATLSAMLRHLAPAALKTPGPVCRQVEGQPVRVAWNGRTFWASLERNGLIFATSSPNPETIPPRYLDTYRPA